MYSNASKVACTIVLTWSLLLQGSHGRIWRSSSPRVWKSPPSSLSIHPSTVLLRGGDDSKIFPEVPESTLTPPAGTTFHSEVARGGSTRTRKHKTVSPRGSSISISSSSITATSTSPTTALSPTTAAASAISTSVDAAVALPASAVPANATTSTKQVVTPGGHKRYKRIAKKLQVSSA